MQGGSLRVNPLKHPTIECDHCNSVVFNSGVILKRIPGIEMGTGTEDQILDLPVYYCAECGTILKEYRKMYKMGEFAEEIVDDAKTEETKSSLILDF